MGIVSTFREAFKFRLQQAKKETYLGYKIYWKGKFRKVIGEDSKQIALKGVNYWINKESVTKHTKYYAGR